MSELSSQPFTIQTMYSWYSENKLFVNRRYQRKLVWTLEEKQKLIESIQKKYPIPAILIAERRPQGTYEIIDGLQRLHAIMAFIETSFPTLDGRHFDIKNFPTAKSRAESGEFTTNSNGSLLSQKEINTILDYNLAVSVMRGATKKEINDVFGRINTYGHRLSDQERRQAGVQNEFSDFVRSVACILRGDTSTDTLLLSKMPSISIDLPKTKHGYDVQAEEVFWVSHGILRATDLRDSLDEQCIADITASLVSQEIIDRSKDALDNIYSPQHQEASRVLKALDDYGTDKLMEEIKHCISQILIVCNMGKPEKLRDIVFKKKTTNAFPSVFAIVLIAFHELMVGEGKKVADQAGVKKALTNIASKIDKGRIATSPSERRKNVDVVKGLIGRHFVATKEKRNMYSNPSIIDIEANIRRSGIELAGYEMKQGLLSLSDARGIDPNIIDKVVKTMCAIANNGPNREGKIVVGVADKQEDADRIVALDKIKPKKVGLRYIVGVAREAKTLSISIEQYVSQWKQGIKNSKLSTALKDAILSSIDYNNYYGLGVLTFNIPPQKEMSYVGDDVYHRVNDATELAKSRQVASITRRFADR
ncbi:MAG: DUF262 domain-containing protein [Alphaproteobacteria bacterium]|nr:DUF262 domain-containing protein [Alphaproteobacteria bacterium]